MRNERRRCGQVRRLLESGRGVVARITPCLIARCGEEATPLGVWRDRPTPDPSPIGPRAQSVHLSRFAFPWLKADLGARAPLSGAEWLADIDFGAVVIATPAARRVRRRHKARAVLGGDLPWSEDDGVDRIGTLGGGRLSRSSSAMRACRVGINRP
jgi:hypothetical protein